MRTKALVLALGGIAVIALAACSFSFKSTPTPVTTSPTQVATTYDRATIYLVALDDNGKSGKLIGCGDTAIGVERKIASTSEPVKVALQELFALKDREFAGTELYNSLSASTVKVDSVAENSSVLTVNLSGKFSLIGTCEDARMEAQIVETVANAPGVTKYQIFFNGKPLRDAFSTA